MLNHVIRIKKLNTHCKLWNMKRKILLNFLKGKYGHFLGEFSNTLLCLGLEELNDCTTGIDQ